MKLSTVKSYNILYTKTINIQYPVLAFRVLNTLKY